MHVQFYLVKIRKVEKILNRIIIFMNFIKDDLLDKLICCIVDNLLIKIAINLIDAFFKIMVSK